MTDNHFEDEEWTDFIRSTASHELKTRIEEHLATGCAQCDKSLALWKSVSIVAKRELAFQVPSDVVRDLKACFELRKKFPVLSREARIARLIFDSFRDPLPAGVRGRSAPGRRLLHESGDFHIDLSLERKDGRLAVAGQVLKRNGSPELTQGTCVLFVKGESSVLSQAIANADGEFHQLLDRGDDLKIFLQILDTQLVCIDLKELVLSSFNNS